MKYFNSFTAPNGDVPDNAPEESTRPTDQLFNNLTKEMMQAIEASGQTLTTLTNDDLTQLSKAVNIHALTANVWDCTNVGNNYTLTRSRGDYDANQLLYGGAKISFIASATNTGPVNITIQAGSLSFSLPLLLNGSPLVGGELLSSEWYEVVYYSGTMTLLGGRYALKNMFIGIPFPYPLATAPSGWITMAGQAINPITSPKLAAIYGSNLPDLRGEFVRGWDNSRGIDTARQLLSFQAASSVLGTPIDAGTGTVSIAPLNVKLLSTVSGPGAPGSINQTGIGRYEVYPRNIAFNYITPQG